jgi:hypothetical protein
MQPNYYITPVNHSLFDNANPDKKKEFCLLGVHMSLSMPRTIEFVLRDEHNDDTRLKQKEESIKYLEDELRIVREKHTKELDIHMSSTSHRINYELSLMRKRFDVHYGHIENENIKLTEEIQRLINEGRATYV